MVLRGAVKPITDPHLNESNEVPDSRSSTPLLPEDNEKEVKLIKIFDLNLFVSDEKKIIFVFFIYFVFQPQCHCFLTMTNSHVEYY